MSHKKKKQPPCPFVFSPEMLHLTQQAMELFAQSLGRAEVQAEKVAFARETMQQIQEKLKAMRASLGSRCLTGFDYNEKLVIGAAIAQMIVDLRDTPPSSQRERNLQRCQRILSFATGSGAQKTQPERRSKDYTRRMAFRRTQKKR